MATRSVGASLSKMPPTTCLATSILVVGVPPAAPLVFTWAPVTSS